MDIGKNILNEIEERQSIFFEIERILFTKRYNLSKRHYDILSIQSIPMIYSIWEGFIQQAFGLYVDELNSLNIDFASLNNSIKISHLENTFKQLTEYPQKETSKVKYYDKLGDFFSTDKHLLHRQINTQSNVSFEVLNSILESFNLEPFEKYWDKYQHPSPNLELHMRALLNYRNGIAHGGDISSEEKVNQKVFAKYRTLILDLMYEIRDKMLIGIENKTYMQN